MQVCFECSIPAVLTALELHCRTPKEEFAKCFGGVPGGTKQVPK
jgi:hypothetical protein